ncbi:hypothetical protein ACIBG8_26375 [Nonomuraea sp. NPDC050556]|uniref:hypothetical protein n=1 Tax=Nonomuraea sp. NPDC050556 TaxID=3364369 RepID=UPI0037A1CB02
MREYLPLVYTAVAWTVLGALIKAARENNKSGRKPLSTLSAMALAGLLVASGVAVLAG